MTPASLLRALFIAVTFSMFACSSGGGGGAGGGSAGTGGGTAGTGGGTNDAGTGGGGSTTTPDKACTDYATAACNRYTACAPFYIQVTYPDMPTCIARYKLLCAPAFGVNGGGVTTTNAEACATAIMAESCTDLLNGQPAACDIRGTLANGTACGTDSQCTSGYCNIGTNGCGVCAARAAAGGACTTTGDCTLGLVCGGSVCKSPGNAGDTCSATAPCLGSLACTSGNVCAAASTTPGAACMGSTDCAGVDGIYCNTNMVCATISVAAPGAACGFVAGGLVACTGGTYCKTTPPAVMGTCAADAADGAACDAASTQPCISPATCVSSLCKLPDPGACN